MRSLKKGGGRQSQIPPRASLKAASPQFNLDASQNFLMRFDGGHRSGVGCRKDTKGRGRSRKKMDEDSPIKQMVAANLATLDPACDSPPRPDEPLNVTLGRRMKYPGDRGYVKFLTG